MHERPTPTAERCFERDPLRGDVFRTAIDRLLVEVDRIARGETGYRLRTGRLVETLEISLRAYLAEPTADPLVQAEAERTAAQLALLNLRTTMAISDFGSEVAEWPATSSYVDSIAALLQQMAEATGGPEDNEVARSVALRIEQLFSVAINEADAAGVRLAYVLYEVQAEAEEAGVSELIQTMRSTRDQTITYESEVAHWVGCAMANQWPTEESNLSVPCVLIWSWLDGFWVVDADP